MHPSGTPLVLEEHDLAAFPALASSPLATDVRAGELVVDGDPCDGQTLAFVDTSLAAAAFTCPRILTALPELPCELTTESSPV